MKLILFFSIFISSFSSHAAWVLDNKLTEIDTKDTNEIIGALAWASDGMNVLNSINLISSSKIVVNDAQVLVAIYNWEDDENCTAIDPGQYQGVRMTDYQFGFHYQDDINFEGLAAGSESPLVLCQEQKLFDYSKIKKKIVKKN